MQRRSLSAKYVRSLRRRSNLADLRLVTQISDIEQST